MEILFLILKIIGILFGFILLLFLAALVVPVRYGICMEAQDDISGAAVFSWFCRLISLKIEYKEKGITFRLRILGIPVSFGREKKKRSKKARKKKAEKKNPEIENITPKLQEPAVLDVPKPQELPAPENQKEKKLDRKRKGPREWWKSVCTGFGALRQWITSVRDKTTTGIEKFQNIKKLISEETNKSALLHLLQELRFLIRHYSPRKAIGELAFGMEDPGQTGQILGMVSLFPFWARYRINVTPDFQAESFYVKGRLQMKGHIRIWHFLWPVFRLIKDKNVKALITSFRT